MSDDREVNAPEPILWHDDCVEIEGEGFEHFDTLLQGRDAWWEFLEAKSRSDTLSDFLHADGVGGHGLELERVGRVAERQEKESRPAFLPTHTHNHLRCALCDAQVPLDLTFCVCCGGNPGFVGRQQWQFLVVESIHDTDVLLEVVEMLLVSNTTLDAKELTSALKQPPAVFSFYGQDDHAHAMIDRFQELGVYASVSSSQTPTFSMTRELAEATLRQPQYVALHLGILLLGAMLAFAWSLMMALGMGVALTLALGAWQARKYEERYVVDAVLVLNALTGFDSAMVESARKVLIELQGQEVRNLLTICLMEYYGTWRHLAASDPALRRNLSMLRQGLGDILTQVIASCARYNELHVYRASMDVAKLEHEVTQLQGQELEPADAQLLAQRKKQLMTLHEVEEVLPQLYKKLLLMCASLESLRARVVSVTVTRKATESDDHVMEQMMRGLDAEVFVFEEAAKSVLDDVMSDEYVCLK